MRYEASREHPEADDPITDLAGFALEPDAGFVERLERSIHRRETSAGLVELSSVGFMLMTKEFLSMVLSLLGSGSQSDEGDPHV